MHTAVQALQLLASLLEPFMPGFSAKVYKQMNIQRTEREETLYGWLKGDPDAKQTPEQSKTATIGRLKALVPAGHKIGEP